MYNNFDMNRWFGGPVSFTQRDVTNRPVNVTPPTATSSVIQTLGNPQPTHEAAAAPTMPTNYNGFRFGAAALSDDWMRRPDITRLSMPTYRPVWDGGISPTHSFLNYLR